LQQQRAFANARVAADQHHATWHDAAAQNAVKLFQAAGCAGHLGHFDLGQVDHRLAFGQRLEAVVGAGAGGRGHLFVQRVPGIALRAAAQPLGAGAAAFTANKNRAFLGHAALSGMARTRASSSGVAAA
jgi:hypothetical protein